MTISSLTQEQLGGLALSKMYQQGRQALNDSELLYLILHKQLECASLLEVAQKILKSFEGRLTSLAKLDIASLSELVGISPEVAASVLAAFELGRRREVERTTMPKKINSSEAAYLHLQRDLRDLEVEQCWILLLDSGNEEIHTFKMSEGGLTSTIIDIRVVFKAALKFGATGMIVYHNHPSGEFFPSEADVVVTHRLEQAGVLLNIKLMDHIIIGQRGYFSFADQGLLI